MSAESFTFDSVSGIIMQSKKGSKFIRFHMESHLAKELFNPEKQAVHGKDVDVLQVMLCSACNFLVEFIYKETTNE